LIRIKYKCGRTRKNCAPSFGGPTVVTITQALSRHHKLCDSLFTECEAAASEQRWDDVDACHARFCSALDAHLAAEESLLFPALEALTGLQGGPTQVMREEHAQMRGVLERMTQAASRRQHQDYADFGEMLLILMQQHNLKEENILYPMCDRSLATRSDELGTRLEEVLTPP